nr:MAG TPA: hypothetical protein [Caudoviricetes sp.]
MTANQWVPSGICFEYSVLRLVYCLNVVREYTFCRIFLFYFVFVSETHE